ncbi:Putative membrane protein [Corynebacterium glyciniphilum AJ 3170]|uniref:Putative membrane protein n=1 Tax=Corynebacterium glyciniphilum AJ 3170 TaxID=1404245 RepID=X5DNG1_9CORY|nr:Putative membrane protein [Corynebacterium glyciniphilum AJ 3170]
MNLKYVFISQFRSQYDFRYDETGYFSGARWRGIIKYLGLVWNEDGEKPNDHVCGVFERGWCYGLPATFTLGLILSLIFGSDRYGVGAIDISASIPALVSIIATVLAVVAIPTIYALGGLDSASKARFRAFRGHHGGSNGEPLYWDEGAHQRELLLLHSSYSNLAASFAWVLISVSIGSVAILVRIVLDMFFSLTGGGLSSWIEVYDTIAAIFFMASILFSFCSASLGSVQLFSARGRYSDPSL